MSYSKNKLKLKVVVFLLITTLIFWLVPSNLIFGEGEEQAGGGEVIVDADADANAPAEEGEESYTVKVDVVRVTPPGNLVNMTSGATFSVTFRIENANTGPDDRTRTNSGNYTLTYSANLTPGSDTPDSGTTTNYAGLVSNWEGGTGLSLTYNFTAPTSPASGIITLSATVTSVYPSRTLDPNSPVNDVLSDSESYGWNVLGSSDTTAPEGSITINNDAPYTNNTSVTLNLAATDAVGVTQYRVANGIDASGGTVVAVTSTISFSTDISWTLPSEDGTKTVAVQYGDAANNWSSNYMDSIILDQTPPVIVAGTPSGTPGLNGWWLSAVTVPFSATDNLSGFAPDGVLSINLASKTTVGEGAALYVTSDGISDRAGNSAVGIQAGPFKVDQTPPVVTVTLPDTGLGSGVYLLNEEVSASWSDNDPTPGSGLATPPTGTIPIDTSSVGKGKILIVPAATAVDNAGNESVEVQITYSVQYAFGGILQPINPNGTSIFKFGSTVPVKFQLRDADGNFVTNAVARIFVQKISNGSIGTEMEAVSTAAATTGNLFRYSSDGNQYIFNLNTKLLSTGTWQIRIELDDGASQCVNISLK